MLGYTEIVQIIASFIGTLAFGVLFNIRDKKLIFTGLGGLLSWFAFILLGYAIENEAVRYFVVSVFIAAYAEVLARFLKTPTTVFCVVSLFPLIPGGALYYTMKYALEHDWKNFIDEAVYTIELAAAISIGIMIVAACVKYYKKLYGNIKKKRRSNFEQTRK